jgi:hypothetical protein
MEEMYVFLYEINQDDDVTSLHPENKVLIYPTYSVNSKTDDLFPIPRKSAKFPSDSTLFHLAKAFGIIDQFDSTGNKLAIDIFKTISSTQQQLVVKLFKTTVTYQNQDVETDAPPLKISEN